MKILVAAILTGFLGITSFAGNGNEGVNPTKNILHKWQKEFVLYPEKSLKEDKKGTVYVSFTLTEKGLMRDIKIEEGITQDLNLKAIEIAISMPKDHLLTPNFEEGKKYILPVKFSIR
ncbi:MAG: hypothetical protein ACI857_000039 [Arenicella sp.]|jgi:hypothetical protein